MILFDVTSHTHANKQQVKLQCIQKLSHYFNINNMQFTQPIYKSKIENELMTVDGVRSVNNVMITQAMPNGRKLFTYAYSTSNGNITNDEGTPDYGWKYDFSAASSNEQSDVYLPPHPDNPAVFELKSPTNDIQGVVR